MKPNFREMKLSEEKKKKIFKGITTAAGIILLVLIILMLMKCEGCSAKSRKGRNFEDGKGHSYDSRYCGEIGKERLKGVVVCNLSKDSVGEIVKAILSGIFYLK